MSGRVVVEPDPEGGYQLRDTASGEILANGLTDVTQAQALRNVYNDPQHRAAERIRVRNQPQEESDGA